MLFVKEGDFPQYHPDSLRASSCLVELAYGESSHFRLRFPEDATLKHIKANTITTWPWICELPEAKTLPPTGEFGLGNTIEYSVEAGVIN